jgi:hypothetical protein
VTPETEAEWRELRPRPVEVEAAPDEEDELPTTIYVPLPPEPESAPERDPPLVEAAEAIRRRARQVLQASVPPPAAEPTGSFPPAAGVLSNAKQPRPGGGRGVRPGSQSAAVLRALLRTDGAGLRTAVLYREVLGAPLGLRSRPGGWEGPLDDA